MFHILPSSTNGGYKNTFLVIYYFFGVGVMVILEDSLELAVVITLYFVCSMDGVNIESCISLLVDIFIVLCGVSVYCSNGSVNTRYDLSTTIYLHND